LQEAIDDECPLIAHIYLKSIDETPWIVVYGYDRRSNRVYVANYAGWWIFGDHQLQWKEFNSLLLEPVLVCSRR